MDFGFFLSAQSGTVMMIIPLTHYGNNFATKFFGQRKKKMCRSPTERLFQGWRSAQRDILPPPPPPPAALSKECSPGSGIVHCKCGIEMYPMTRVIIRCKSFDPHGKSAVQKLTTIDHFFFLLHFIPESNTLSISCLDCWEG